MDPARREIGWWDDWNTRYRSGPADPASVSGELGQIVHGAVCALGYASPRVVEVGCGTGRFAETLTDVQDYLGLDLSPAAIASARERVPWGRFEAADFHEWTLPDQPFDVAILVDSIAYFRSQDQAVAKLFDLLRPGGHLVLSTVNPFVYGRTSWVGPPGDGQVRRWLSRRDLEQLLVRHRFVMCRYFTVMPAGDRGILRLVNSAKLNTVASQVMPTSWLRKMKEAAGLGQYQIAIAQRPDARPPRS